ncbi:hypothetical protein KUTeg_018963 [Tegillarca granosa]|uniref:Nuclease HARBI1 n=1 Tax=Tegillarca granosa TaxID=220873 RepID=A0ABQ9EF89_TEGGR|nr:hypothetical protein KUTeg_018963 [Tegillarca granosa]
MSSVSRVVNLAFKSRLIGDLGLNMAGIVHWFDELQYRRALRRERVFRDRTNLLDIYDDVELYYRFCLPRNRLINLINELGGELEHVTRRRRAIPVELQVIVALRFLSSGSFQNLVGDMVNIDRTTAYSGYPLMQWFMVPVMNPVDDAERKYNRAHMSTRSKTKVCMFK